MRDDDISMDEAELRIFLREFQGKERGDQSTAIITGRPLETLPVIDDDDSNYPPYPSVVQMAKEAHDDGKGQQDVLVVIIAAVVAGIAAGALLVVYGVV